MRMLEMEKKGDIIISELLGSFGDNELSPECLYPTVKFLKAEGIFIPYAYTSYIVPISSQILWKEVNEYAQNPRVTLPQQMYPFEMSYVVKIYSASYPCGKEAQPVFTFHHFTDKNAPEDNQTSFTRTVTLKFVCQDQQALLHGLAGYFDANLYQEVFYSTLPKTHTPGMHSWFPLYFPIKDPIPVFKGCEVAVSIARCTGQNKVWFEWSISVVDPLRGAEISTTATHNVGGRGLSIGL